MLKTGIAAMAGAAAAGVTTAKAADAKEAAKKEYDVVVVGCGCAGMAAAIEAKQAGYSVCILEKMARPSGNTIYSGGIINACGTYVQKRDGVTDSLDAFYEDMMKVSLGRGDQELTRMYVDKSADAIQWLTDVCDVKYRKLENEVWPMLQRGHVVDGCVPSIRIPQFRQQKGPLGWGFLTLLKMGGAEAPGLIFLGEGRSPSPSRFRAAASRPNRPVGASRRYACAVQR